MEMLFAKMLGIIAFWTITKMVLEISNAISYGLQIHMQSLI